MDGATRPPFHATHFNKPALFDPFTPEPSIHKKPRILVRAPSLVSYLASKSNASKARERICFRKSDVFAAINGLHVSSHVTWTSEARH